VNSSDHVEVDGIPAEFESLANVFHFDVTDATNARLITWRVDHNVSAILVYARSFGITAVKNVAGEESNFSLHGNIKVSKSGHLSQVTKLKWLVQSNNVTIDCSDESCFGLYIFEYCSSNYDLFTDVPINNFV